MSFYTWLAADCGIRRVSMFNLIKKDMLNLAKNKSELMELLLMPMILILILGFALGGILSGDQDLESFKVGLVSDSSPKEDLESFQEDLSQAGYPDQAQESLLEAARNNDPQALLADVLSSPDLANLVEIEEFSNKDLANQALEEEEIVSYLYFPENFNLHYLRSIYLGEDSQARLDLQAKNQQSFYSNLFADLTKQVLDEFNLQISLMTASQGQGQTDQNRDQIGSIRSLSVEDPVTAFQYFTLAMGVMFALLIPVTVSLNSFEEKRNHLYDRLTIAGLPWLSYLFSKFFASFFLALSQLAILFTFSTLFFGVFSGKDLTFWLGLASLTLFFALVVASLGALLVSLTIRTKKRTVANSFSLLVFIFALLGGSFFPLDQVSDSLIKIGEWTPNGAALQAYLQALQGFSLQEILPTMLRLGLVAAGLVLLALTIYPKRRMT